MVRHSSQGTLPRAADGPRLARAGRFLLQHDVSAPQLWLLALGDDAWAIEGGAPTLPGDPRIARRLPPGPVPPGAGWDFGDYEVGSMGATEITFSIEGRRLRGRYVLRRIGEVWALERLDPVTVRPMPDRVLPMLATSGSYPSDEARFAFEPKWDGIRALAFVRDGTARLRSRNQLEITDRYPEIASLAEVLRGRAALLDGEIVAFDERGRPSFQLLQGRLGVTERGAARRLSEASPIRYVVFDVLHLDGTDTTPLPYEERRALLESLDLDSGSLRTTPMSIGAGRALLATPGLEGVVAKRLGSPYEPGARSRAWIKVKTTRRQELVIGGWTSGRGARRGRIGALLLGVYEGDRLRYAGNVGTGFSERALDDLQRLLAPLVTPTSPFADDVEQKDVTFVDPRIVAEVEFTEWTKEGKLRHPSFKGLREDKDPREVVKEDA